MFSSFLSSFTCAACRLLIYHTFIAKYIVNSKCCIKFSQKAAKLYGLVLCCSSLLVPHNVLMAQSGLNCDSRVARAAAAAAAELARSLARNVDKWVSFVLSEFLASNRFVRSCQLRYLRALTRTLSLAFVCLPQTHTRSLSLSCSLRSQCKAAASCIIYACLQLPLPSSSSSSSLLRCLSQKHSDRGIVSAQGTLENQCSSLPRRVRLCTASPAQTLLCLVVSQSHCEKNVKYVSQQYTNDNNLKRAAKRTTGLSRTIFKTKNKTHNQKFNKTYKLFSFKT